jgi:hypothetical protein
MYKSPKSLNNCVDPIQFMGTARDALYKILKTLNFNEEKKLLLPSYIGVTDREGSGVFDPVEQTNTPYQFYTLNKKLSALKGELYNFISSGNYCALLIIHYFGLCQNDMNEIVSLCNENNVLLIEDCAHSMLSETPYGKLGTLGDFSIFSIHKFLATKDGGCLRVNNKDYEYLLQEPSSTKPNLETLDVRTRSDLNAVREKRRNNYLYLTELIDVISEIEIMYPELPDGIAPHNFPIIINNGQRESLYFKLIDRGVPVIALYYRMIDPILQGGYKESIYISDNILNLPIHQDITKSNIEEIIRRIKE